jgi:aldehyde:ferredoxin oxidoreductase
MTDPVAILKASALCNEYGLDVDGAANGLAWAFELFERGLLTVADTDGLELRWGDHLAMNNLLERIGRGEGFGRWLGQGVGRAAQRLGRGTGYYGLTSKGHDLNEGALRSHKGWALGILTSARGGGHLNGAPSTEFQGVSAEDSRRVFGVDTAGIPEEYGGKPEVLVYFERLKAIVDALGMCVFTSQWSDLALLGPQDFAALYSSATGDERTGEDLMALGERLVHLERHFNRLHARFGRQDDYPPERLVREPIRTGPHAGQRLDLEQWDRMLDRYYALHGWDVGTGWPATSLGDW